MDKQYCIVAIVAIPSIYEINSYCHTFLLNVKSEPQTEIRFLLD